MKQEVKNAKFGRCKLGDIEPGRIALLAGICCLLLVSGCARIGTRDVGSIEVCCSPVIFVVSLNDDDDNYSKVPVTMYLEGIGRSTRANDIGFEYHWNI